MKHVFFYKNVFERRALLCEKRFLTKTFSSQKRFLCASEKKKKERRRDMFAFSKLTHEHRYHEQWSVPSSFFSVYWAKCTLNFVCNLINRAVSSSPYILPKIVVSVRSQPIAKRHVLRSILHVLGVSNSEDTVSLIWDVYWGQVVNMY